jgi:isocitrate dehydrogenase
MNKVSTFLHDINKALEDLNGISYKGDDINKFVHEKVKPLLPNSLKFPVTVAYLIPQKAITLDAFKYHLFVLKKDVTLTKKSRIHSIEQGIIKNLSYLINEKFNAPTIEEMIVLQEKAQRTDRIKYLEIQINDQVMEITRMKAELMTLRKEKKELEKENQ